MEARTGIPGAPRHRRLTILLTQTEHECLFDAAEAEGTSVSEYVRAALRLRKRVELTEPSALGAETWLAREPDGSA